MTYEPGIILSIEWFLPHPSRLQKRDRQKPGAKCWYRSFGLPFGIFYFRSRRTKNMSSYDRRRRINWYCTHVNKDLKNLNILCKGNIFIYLCVNCVLIYIIDILEISSQLIIHSRFIFWLIMRKLFR